MNCPECESENTVSYTGKELRYLNLLVWRCFDCGKKWESNSPPIRDIEEY